MNETGVIFCLLRGGKVLMQQRDGNCKKFPFMWCLPGGTREEHDKTYEETLLREIKEEYSLELSIEQCTQFMEYNDGADKVYLCNLGPNQEPVLKEGLAMRWMTIDEIERIELGFNQYGIIPVLKKMVT